MRHSVGRSRLGLASLLIALGCSDVTRVCTLVGCQTGLFVHLATLPSRPFIVEVRAGSDVAYIFDCTKDTSHCRQDIVFPGLVADGLNITVRVDGASRVTEVRPVYTHNQPNGPNCEPDCQSALVTVEIPS